MTEIFKGRYDTFMFGNTILQAVIIYNLEYEKYRPLVEALTSLNNPLNAEQALKLVKKIKTNL